VTGFAYLDGFAGKTEDHIKSFWLIYKFLFEKLPYDCEFRNKSKNMHFTLKH